MSYVIADPEMMTSAASDLATFGSNVSAAHMVAAAPTVAVLPAAADEVSTGIAQLFSQHAADYQAMAAQAAAFNDQFVQTLKSGGAAYAQADATSAATLWSLWSLLPPGIQNDLLTAGIDAALFFIFGIFIGYFAFAYLVSTLILHPLGWA
jgi:methionine synthase II (cobalamin-independent)